MTKDNKFIEPVENPFVKFDKGVNDFFGELCDILDDIKRGATGAKKLKEGQQEQKQTDIEKKSYHEYFA